MAFHPMATRTKAAAPTRGTRLFVSGVAPDVKKTDLQQEFGEFGHVVDIEMPLTARGVAFVQFDNPRDAREAMEEVTGRRLKGMVLKVKHADTKPEGKKGPDEPMSKAAHPEEQERRQRAPLQQAGAGAEGIAIAAGGAVEMIEVRLAGGTASAAPMEAAAQKQEPMIYMQSWTEDDQSLLISSRCTSLRAADMAVDNGNTFWNLASSSTDLAMLSTGSESECLGAVI
eukprot:CAMPEP_0178426648 /NCGR_PEP_ID=MMETSP0689_2-20121128/29341_1 /TAXON_ID=160604 /ORGANISM="Amphidinium massartii, Strain CS-259" /LENGTH=227 /DNA_ID=CAMNT_0020048337 /DNA_START=81 /DNA_END=766 /DNA_ORIENTATION=-